MYPIPRPSTRRALLLAALAAPLLYGCTDRPDGITGPASQSVRAEEAGPAQDRTSEFPSIRRVDLQLRAAGALRPGVPIHVTAVARANRAADDVQYELLVLDDDGAAAPAPGRSRQPARLGQWSGTLPARAERALSGTVTFARPGYYRVMARATAAPGAETPRPGRDTLVFNASTETLWMLVDESGGRLTAGFDSAAAYGDASREPRYGSYGAFVPRRAAAGGPTASAALVPSFDHDTEPHPGYEERSWGYVYHTNLDNGMVEPLAGAEVRVTCLYWWDQGNYDYSVYTDGNGYYDIKCPQNYPYHTFQWIAVYLENQYADVRGRAGASSGAISYSSGPQNFRVANDQAAHVFKQLSAKVPVAEQRFGRSATRVSVYAADADPNYGIFYRSNENRIYTNYTRIPGEDGWFVTLHEYGHAFHWKNVDEWGSYSCTNNEHFWTETENLSCAFVEGFADFFAMWLVGDKVNTAPYGGDYGVENNVSGYPYGSPTNPPAGGDGVRVEAAVAAFLYDLVDGPDEPDGLGNTVGGEESWDGATYPAGWVADMIRYCNVGGVTRMTGADQMVYCLEASLTGYTESRRWSTAWRSYGSLSYERTLARYSQPMIRRLWKYNMYGVLE
jgi:hypothetical protein